MIMAQQTIVCPKCGETNIGTSLIACAACGEDIFVVQDTTFPPSLKIIMWLSFFMGLGGFLAIVYILISEDVYPLEYIILIPFTVNLAVGWGILKRKYWARKLAITVWTILLILNILSISIFYIALDLFILYALQTPEAKMFFRNIPKTTIKNMGQK
jgi:hypothetical protein